MILFFGSEMLIEGLVSNEIKKQINNAPSSLYTLQTGKVKLKFLSGGVEIENITLQPNDSALNLLSENKVPSLLTLKVDNFELNGFKILRLLRKNDIDIRTLAISNINLELYKSADYIENDTTKKVKIGDIFTEHFQEAIIQKMKIMNFEVRSFNAHDTLKPEFELDSLSLTFDDILINQKTLQKHIPVAFSNMNINSGDLTLNTLEYYKIATSDISLTLADSTLHINGFRLIPRYTREAFNQKQQYNTDWFNIVTPVIRVNKIHFAEWIQEGVLHLNSIEIEGPEIIIYRDKNLPDAPFKHKPLLASLLHKIEKAIRIDSMFIKDGSIQYEELIKNGKQPGKIVFKPFSITATNITNHDSVIAKNEILNVSFTGNLMEKTRLEADLNIDLSGNSDYFKVKGSLGPFQASVLNPVVEKMMFVSIESGDIQNTDFVFYANDDVSQGQLFMQYDDLKVKVLSEEDHEKARAALSFAANNIIRNKNLKTDRKFLVGQINFDRDKNKGIVNYIWNSVKSGLISIVAPVASRDNKAEKRKRSGKIK
ncbi:MAG: hypothetical protein KQI35_01415 [Bacteroidetes bacterium]|nr:hypothetical protein [Bacteroidota bacterium]